MRKVRFPPDWTPTKTDFEKVYSEVCLHIRFNNENVLIWFTDVKREYGRLKQQSTAVRRFHLSFSGLHERVDCPQIVGVGRKFHGAKFATGDFASVSRFRPRKLRIRPQGSVLLRPEDENTELLDSHAGTGVYGAPFVKKII